MKTVAPFRAWRYSPAAGEPSQLIAPPYDIIGPDLRSRLYARSPYNVVRVDFGMTAPADSDENNQYTRAAALLADWKKSGILVRDPLPTITFVEEHFTGLDGRPGVRYGFLAAMRLYEFDEGVVFPHEQTLSGPKEDRYRLMMATAMSLSPVFLLYDLSGDEITAAWKTTLAAHPPACTVTDDAGTVTRVWPTADPGLVKAVGQNLAASRFIIADGHHRYETALRYQKHRRQSADKSKRGGVDLGRSGTGRAAAGSSRTGDPSVGDQAYDYVLAYFSNMADPGLAVYSTHRLVRGLDRQLVASLPRSLAETFTVEPLGTASTGRDAYAAIAAYLRDHPRGAFGLWGPVLDGAYGLKLSRQAAVREAKPLGSAAYQELDVTILQTLILGRALGITPTDMATERHVAFFNDPNEAVARLEAGQFQAGFFMNPPGLDQIRRVAFGGERMPQKATFFYPKLPTGLVFHDLNGPL